jgi:solute carrier family 35 protein E3
MNIALAHSSILFYQVIRILLTPVTAMINFLFYGSKLPKYAAMALLPACVGVGLVSYADSLAHSSERPHQPLNMKPTSTLGITFSLFGLICSSVYTVWIAHYHSRLHLSSIQLLYNQVPICAVLLSLLSFFTDTFPAWKDVSSYQWCLLLISGGCACMIHLSTFYIINTAGPVTSTVVAQMKTCLIVGLGWVMNPGDLGGHSLLGIILALAGIMFYSLAMYRDRAR